MSLNAKRKRKSILVLHLIWFLCDADAHTMAGVLNKLLQATQATAAVAPPSFSILIKLHFWMIFFRAASFRTNSEKWTWVQMLNTSHKVVPIFFAYRTKYVSSASPSYCYLCICILMPLHSHNLLDCELLFSLPLCISQTQVLFLFLIFNLKWL